MERKLTTILSADVRGYSRLMSEDDAATVRTLTAHRALMTSLIQHHKGRVVDSPGDNLLAEFASVVDAVQGAVAIQQALQRKNAELPTNRQMAFRIGINLGDVIVGDGRLYGDGVNIAARLEALAEAGGICISGKVYEAVKSKLALGYEYLGEQQLKNIAEPVRVWRVHWEESSGHHVASSPSSVQGSTFKVQGERRAGVARRRWTLGAGSGLVFIVGAFLVIRHLSSPTLNPQSPTPNTQPPLSTQDSALSPEAAPAALPLPDKPSIVVLPFVNMSKDPDQEYFSDGLTDVLTGDLSKISSLFVIARNSAFTYKGKAVKVQDVGREMGVRYVLEGSVQKADQRVRIAVQLIEATTGYHLWSEQYDRPLKDIFALQDEIVQKIVTTLKLQLTLQEQGWIVRKHTDNLEAYDAFLRGMEYFERFAKEANAQARQMFEQAIALDPQYAEAYAKLGWTYLVEWNMQWSMALHTLERAGELAHQALALDDSLPMAHSLLSNVYARKQQDDQAIAEGARAITLDPNNAEVYNRQGAALNFAGRPEEALPMMEQAMRLNPHYPPFYIGDLGWTYFLVGRYAEAVAALKEALSRGSTLMVYYDILANSYVSQWASQQGADSHTLEQALAAAQRGLALNDAYFWGHVRLGLVYLYQKQYEPALAEMERTIALDPNSAYGYAGLAEVLSRVGRPEEAVRMAEQALRRKLSIVADDYLNSVGVAYDLAGRPEEVIAPLKQYLSHYPDILSAHLTLAAVYSELGKDAEAQAETAEVLRINPKFSLEVHKEREAIKDPTMLERHIAALRKGGLK